MFPPGGVVLWGPSRPPFSHQLPRKLYANLHLASAAAELLRVDEPIGGHIGIGATQGVIDRPKDHPRLKYARLSQREIRMIENIHRINAELKAKPFVYLGVLQHRHIPDVHSRSSEGVTPQVGESTRARLHITCRGILS